MGDSVLQRQEELAAGRDPKFTLLYEQATAGESLSTDDLVAVLARWDAQFGVTVLGTRGDSVSLEFDSIPDDVDSFLQEVIEICPDAADGRKQLLAQLEKNKTLLLWWD